ncbi:MAG: hypothetical protein ACI8Y7_000011 [Candidatus Woesearchaeota archaeon]|jgi:hypothetical protein
MKSKADSKLIFLCSLGSFIPYINYFIAPLIIIASVHQIIKIRAEPKEYGGFGYVVLAVIISIVMLFFSVIEIFNA